MLSLFEAVLGAKRVKGFSLLLHFEQAPMKKAPSMTERLSAEGVQLGQLRVDWHA